ncbi:TSUP family transporter [Alishewanella sp. HL-SH06]
MTSASIFILSQATDRKIFKPLLWMIPCCFVGFILGMQSLQNLPVYIIQALFLSLITAFAVVYSLASHRGCQAKMRKPQYSELLMMLVILISGGMCASLFGTGADIILYTLLVTRFRMQSLSLGARLEKMAGVSNVATGVQSGKPVLRGLSGDRIRILLDGVPQDHQQYGVRHPPNLDPVLADRVEVVKGPMSVLYGADAMGGVVNVISRPLLLDSGSTGIKRATLFSQYHSNNNQRSLYLDGDASYNNWGGYLGLGQTEADNFATPKVLTYPANNSGTAPLFSGEIPFTDFKARDLASAIGFVNDTFESTLRYTFWSNDQNYLQQNGQPTGQFLKNHNVLFDSAYQFNDVLLIKSRLSWQQNLRDAGTGIAYQALNDDTVDLSLELNRYQGRFSVLHEAIGGWQGELGIDVVNKQQYTHVGNLIPDANSKSYSVFAFERQSAGRWVTEIGLRFDHMKQQADLINA